MSYYGDSYDNDQGRAEAALERRIAMAWETMDYDYLISVGEIEDDNDLQSDD